MVETICVSVACQFTSLQFEVLNVLILDRLDQLLECLDLE